ncbi:MAG: HAD hydrolase-like protein [Merdibacter sp.]
MRSKCFVGSDVSLVGMGELWEPKMTEEQMRRFHEANYPWPDRLSIWLTARMSDLTADETGRDPNGHCLFVIQCFDRANADGNELTPFFDQVISGRTPAASRIRPFIEAMRRLDHTPAQCVVIEDPAIGIEAAKCAGMYVIAKGKSFSCRSATGGSIADDCCRPGCYSEH